MSDTHVTTTTGDAAHGTDPDAVHTVHGDGHASDLLYVKVALILAAFTGIEVLTYFYDFGGAAVATLLVLMVIKFAVVGMYFMHLKFDNKIFTQMFVAGLAFAIVLYCAMLAAFEFW